MRASMLNVLTSALLLVVASEAALAGTFEVKTPEITAGQKSVSFNSAGQNGFPANADPTRYSAEVGAGYGVTSWLWLGAKANFDQPVGDDWQFSTAGVEGQLRFGKVRPGFDFGWYSGVDVRVDRDETNTLTFGPIIQFGDDKASLTFNPFFQQTFGANREAGIAFAYGVMAKREIREGAAFGIEAYGVIPDIGGGTPVAFQEHRIGPVLYLETDLVEKRRGGGEAPKASLDIGLFFGMTEATPDLTGKVKFGVTW